MCILVVIMVRSRSERTKYWAKVMATTSPRYVAEPPSPAELEIKKLEDEKLRIKVEKQVAHRERMRRLKSEAAERKHLRQLKHRQLQLQQIVERHNKEKCRREEEQRDEASSSNVSIDAFTAKEEIPSTTLPLSDNHLLPTDSKYCHEPPLLPEPMQVISNVFTDITDRLYNKQNLKKTGIVSSLAGKENIIGTEKGKLPRIFVLLLCYPLSGDNDIMLRVITLVANEHNNDDAVMPRQVQLHHIIMYCGYSYFILPHPSKCVVASIIMLHLRCILA